MFFILLIAVFVFLTVQTLVYQLFLYQQMHVSLSSVREGVYSPQAQAAPPAVRQKPNPLRSLLKVFAFLGKFKAGRSLAGRAVPSGLTTAGNPLNIIEFVIFKILSMVIFAISAGILFKNHQIISQAVGLMAGFIVPDLWLKIKIKQRHLQIKKDLPAIIDLLTLCVNAGLDFMLAVNRVIRDFKKCPLTDELSEVWRETRMGASRRDALQHMSRRINLPEVSSFVRTLLQADRMGSPMAEALKIQAEEIRLRLYLRGEEAALKAPIKLLFPLFFFILPAVLVIVAGPIFLQFMRGGVKF